MAMLEELNARVDHATRERNKALQEIRSQCLHTRLAEDGNARPPMRICVDCGAEEQR
jgi:hypothetical protein